MGKNQPSTSDMLRARRMYREVRAELRALGIWRATEEAADKAEHRVIRLLEKRLAEGSNAHLG